MNAYLEAKEKQPLEMIATTASVKAERAPNISVQLESEEISSSSSSHSTKNEMPLWHTHSSVTGKAIRAQQGTLESFDAKKIKLSTQDHEEYFQSLPEAASVAVVTENKEKSDPEVLVNGVLKKLSAITEEDKDLMSTDEYIVSIL